MPEPNEISGKDLFDCCTKQAELAFNSFNARREHQFRITLSLWALLMLATQFAIVQKVHPRLSYCLAISALVLVMHTSFVVGIWLKSNFDEKVFYHYQMRGEGVLTGKPYDRYGFPKHLRLRDGWKIVKSSHSSMFQIATTVLLLAACSVAVLS